MRARGSTGRAALWLPAAAQARAEAPPCTAEQGQALIDADRYEQAVREFTCLVDAQPTEGEGYRGRIEAELLLGRFSDAVRDYTRVHGVRRAGAPRRRGHDPRRLRGAARRRSAGVSPPSPGASFALLWDFAYAQAGQLLNELLVIRPDDVYGNLFRGSSRLLRGGPRNRSEDDLQRAIALAPQSPDVHYVVADAYTYGLLRSRAGVRRGDAGPRRRPRHAARAPRSSARPATRSATPWRRRSKSRGTSTWSPPSSCRRRRSPPARR